MGTVSSRLTLLNSFGLKLHNDDDLDSDLLPAKNDVDSCASLRTKPAGGSSASS